MATPLVTYKIATASAEEIAKHLNACDFEPPLENRVDVIEYAKKLFEKSITFEGWVGDKLVGLVASYFNENDVGFISNVSTLDEFKGNRIASQLMGMCIQYAERMNFKALTLEVSLTNHGAIKLYTKFNFYNVGVRDELIIMRLEIDY